MKEPTGRLKFAYETIRTLEADLIEHKALLLNEEGRIERLLAQLTDKTVQLKNAVENVTDLEDQLQRQNELIDEVVRTHTISILDLDDDTDTHEGWAKLRVDAINALAEYRKKNEG